MTREQLKSMIALHESILARYDDAIQNRLDELEEKGMEMDYFAEATKQKKIIAWFKEQVPDDE